MEERLFSRKEVRCREETLWLESYCRACTEEEQKKNQEELRARLLRTFHRYGIEGA